MSCRGASTSLAPFPNQRVARTPKVGTYIRHAGTWEYATHGCNLDQQPWTALNRPEAYRISDSLYVSSRQNGFQKVYLLCLPPNRVNMSQLLRLANVLLNWATIVWQRKEPPCSTVPPAQSLLAPGASTQHCWNQIMWTALMQFANLRTELQEAFGTKNKDLQKQISKVVKWGS